MNVSILEILKDKGLIKDYKFCLLSADQEVIQEHNDRSTEQLCLVFNDNSVLQIDTFCSGSSECTSLILELL